MGLRARPGGKREERREKRAERREKREERREKRLKRREAQVATFLLLSAMGSAASVCRGSLVGVEVRSPSGFVAWPPAIEQTPDTSEQSTEFPEDEIEEDDTDSVTG